MPPLKATADMREQAEQRWEETTAPRHLIAAELFQRPSGEVSDCLDGHELKYSFLPKDSSAVWFKEEIFLILRALSMQVKRKSKMASGALVMHAQKKELPPKEVMVVRLSGYKEYNSRGGTQVAHDAIARFEMRLRKKPKDSGIYDDVMYLKTECGSLMVAYCPQVIYNLREERTLVMLVLARLIAELLRDDMVAHESVEKILDEGISLLGKKAERTLMTIEKVLTAVLEKPTDLTKRRWCEKTLCDWPEALIWRDWLAEFTEPRILFQDVGLDRLAI